LFSTILTTKIINNIVNKFHLMRKVLSKCFFPFNLFDEIDLLWEEFSGLSRFWVFLAIFGFLDNVYMFIKIFRVCFRYFG